jgi:hypothetical protein
VTACAFLFDAVFAALAVLALLHYIANGHGLQTVSMTPTTALPSVTQSA